MNRLKLALKLSCAAALAWPLLNACGGEDRPDALPGTGATGGTSDGGRRPRPDAGDGSSDVSTDGNGGTGGNRDAGDAGVNQPGAPIVTITSPKALATPTADVLTGGEVTVLCTARKASISGAGEVDASSVSIELLDAVGSPLQESTAAATGNADEYRARFPLVQVPSGRVAFRCRARELSSADREGLHEVQTFVDQGPKITPSEPAMASAKPLNKPVLFDFTVQPERLTPNDPAADIESVTFTTNGKSFVAKPVVGEPGRYSFTVDFNLRSNFSEPPAGSIPVSILAKNKRSANGTVRTTTYFFTIDGTGPVINILSPADAAVVGREVTLQFKVADAHAGNDLEQLDVKINDVSHRYGDDTGIWSEKDGVITFVFDAVSIQNVQAQITINVNAVDKVGNPGRTSRVFFLDQYAPVVDLDPPNIRERVTSGTTTECSNPFDPIGDRAVNDGARITRTALFRAAVWERTNTAPERFFAGVKEDSVKLYLYPNPLGDRMVIDADKDPDRLCDEIPEKVLNASLVHQLTPLAPLGDSWFGNDSKGLPLPVGCTLRSTITPPDRLCMNNTSDLTRLIDHPMAGLQPVVFADTPVAGVNCTGISWEIASFVGHDGWVCLAALAEDTVGNLGVSEPLRICLDDGIASNGAPNCPLPPPPCTDGCRPVRFEDALPGLILPRAQ